MSAVVAPPGEAPAAAVEAPTLDAFLVSVSARAFRFAEAGLRHRDDALDVVQDAMVGMLAYVDQPASEWTPLFWSVLRSRVIDVQRRRRFRLGWLLSGTGIAGEEVDWVDPSPDPSRQNDGREAYAGLVAALRGLPARQREAFSLRVLEEFDVATTARVMGCSEGSVKTHLSRAREALRKHLEDFR